MGALLKSRPVWGAWIEIMLDNLNAIVGFCRAPYGARGLKCQRREAEANNRSRAPYGARGLKFLGDLGKHEVLRVAPRMGRVD